MGIIDYTSPHRQSNLTSISGDFNVIMEYDNERNRLMQLSKEELVDMILGKQDPFYLSKC